MTLTLYEMEPQESFEQAWGDLIKGHRVPELLVGTDYGSEQSWRREMGWEGAGGG